MEVGEIYLVTPVFTTCGAGNQRQPMKGKVVYVHPKRRFAVLEFKGVNRNPRESFWPQELTVRCKHWD